MNIKKLYELDEKLRLKSNDIILINRNGYDYYVTIDNTLESILDLGIKERPIWNANRLDGVALDLHSIEPKDGMVLSYQDYYNAVVPVRMKYNDIDWSGLTQNSFITVDQEQKLISKQIHISDIKVDSANDAGKYIMVDEDGERLIVSEIDSTNYLASPSSGIVNINTALNGFSYFTGSALNRPRTDIVNGYVVTMNSERFTTRTIQLVFDTEKDTFLMRKKQERNDKFDEYVEIYHTGNIPHATTSNEGIVQLSSSITGTSETKAATESAAKKLEDKKLDKNKNLSDLTDISKARDNISVLSKDDVTSRLKILEDKFNSLYDSTTPIGTIRTQACDDGSTSGVWMECDGRRISRSTYSDLYDKIKTSFGSGDGNSTFNIPDLRGKFLRGWDHGRGIDNGRSLGSSQNDEVKSHNHSASSGSAGDHDHEATTNTTGNHDHSVSSSGGHRHRYADSYYIENRDQNITQGDGFFTVSSRGGSKGSDHDNDTIPFIYRYTDTDGQHDHNIGNNGNHSHTVNIRSNGVHNHPITVESYGGTETRPQNVAVMFYIRVK